MKNLLKLIFELVLELYEKCVIRISCNIMIYPYIFLGDI